MVKIFRVYVPIHGVLLNCAFNSLKLSLSFIGASFEKRKLYMYETEKKTNCIGYKYTRYIIKIKQLWFITKN